MPTYESLRAEYESQLYPIEAELHAAIRPTIARHRAESLAFEEETDRRRAEIYARQRAELVPLIDPFRERLAAVRKEWDRRVNALRRGEPDPIASATGQETAS